jgi:hypothetical protein
MEKENYAHQMLVPEIEESSTTHLKRIEFINEWVPFLEAVRAKDPEYYPILLQSFETHWSKNRKPNFTDLIEYILVFLKNAYEINFHVEESESHISVESMNCPLLQTLYQSGRYTETDRRILCFHCSEFNFLKYFRLYGKDYQLRLYPNSCHFYIEKYHEERVNPLFF